MVAFFVGVISAIARLLLVGWLADRCVDWYSSSFEGGSGYFVVFLALGGGIAGFFIGVIGSWWATSRGATFARSLGLVLAVDVGLVAIATLLAWGLADHPPTIDGRLTTPEGPAPTDCRTSPRGRILPPTFVRLPWVTTQNRRPRRCASSAICPRRRPRGARRCTPPARTWWRVRNAAS